ncbi:hypothetical protein D9758_009965 [Tetrapyrgos nigripes]|uniref:Uncharacterized protein n=1 Tax=Tetrapyrgos nigripes TaxID=182062 RepID=A0A8H5CT63_9AGAR|nr:hypothetical protein D9758_009965 [Tetrapyrgos nigripes]
MPQDILTMEAATDASFLFSGNSDLPIGAFIVTSLSGAIALATFLDHNPTVEVTHLLLSDSKADDLQTKPKAPEDSLRNHPAVVNHIVTRAAPTVRTFSYLLYQPKLLRPEGKRPTYAPLFFDNSFPRLRELTLRGVRLWGEEECGPDFYDQDPDEESLPACIFPSLHSVTHLHLATNFGYGQFPSSMSLRESMPSLSHLRLTAVSVPSELRTWRFMDNAEQTQTSISPNLTILYNPDFYPLFLFSDDHDTGPICGTPGVEYDYFLERLGEQSDRLGDKDQAKLRLIWPIEEDYKKYGPRFGIYPVDRAVNDFKVRVLREGDGAWSVPPLEERPWAAPGGQWWLHVR